MKFKYTHLNTKHEWSELIFGNTMEDEKRNELLKLKN